MTEPPDLPDKVLEQRIKAACWLNGIGMRDLREKLGKLEAAKLLAEDMIKGDKPQSARNTRDLAEALNLPQRWFTEPNWWALIDGATEPPEDADGVPEDLIPPEDRPDDLGDEAEQP